ncbi:MAG TPA: hypothetical protein VJY83_07270 [Thiopseudomonas sp.]|nr:hypothetical protein [Thiopseudomonas sp.]
MSSVTIVVLIAGGVFILLFLGYLNNLIEKSTIDKARRKADLIDRQRRCSILSETLPGQLATVELKQLLHRIELHVINELAKVDASNIVCRGRSDDLQQMIAQGAALTVNNPLVVMTSDAQIKDVRFQLESLQAQIIRAVEEKAIPTAEGRQWIGQIRHMLVTVYIDYFNTLGRQFLENNRANQARLVFERAIQFLKKQKNPEPYKQALIEFSTFLAQAKIVLAEQSRPNTDQQSELTTAVTQENEDDADWKKKQIYD